MGNIVVKVLAGCVLTVAIGMKPAQEPVMNKNYVKELTSMWYTTWVKDEMYEYTAKVNQTPQTVPYEKEQFPEELVISMENLICQPLDREFDKAWYSSEDYEFEDTSYAREMDRLGAKDTALTVEKIQESYPQLLDKCKGIDLENDSIYDVYRAIYGDYCEGIFCYQDDAGKDRFLLVCDSGGSYGLREVYQARLQADGSFETFNYFQTRNAGYGRVIDYGDSYYYAYLEYNYNLKIHDRIRLHRLGDAPREECLVVEYVPESYLWRNTFDRYEGNELEAYIKSIQDDIVSDQYLDSGMDLDMDVYDGDEKCGEDELCVIDFTNTGVPVYMDKHSFVPSSHGLNWSLTCKFYIGNGDIEEMTELEKAEIDGAVQTPRLVQMWFKQIGDKVYSFFLYHVEDYNYVLQTALIVGRDISLIRSDVLVPQRHFVISEDVFWYG